MKIKLYGTPISTSHAYKHDKRGYKYLSPKATKLKADYVAQARSQRFGKQKLDGPLFICVEIYWRGREGDFDNYHKLAVDALNGIVWDDDIQIKISLTIKQGKENSDPRIIIHILNMLPSLVSIQDYVAKLGVELNPNIIHASGAKGKGEQIDTIFDEE